MASNTIPEKSQKPKPGAGILGYFQKKSSPSGDEKIPLCVGGDSKDSGLKESDETSPGIDKENKSKLVVKMKPKKKRKKIEMSENPSDEDLELDVILNVKKKKRKFRVSSGSGEEGRPSSSEPTLDIEKIVTVPKPEPEPIQIIAEEVSEDAGQTKTPESKPKKSISSFFQKVTKEERLHKVEKDNSFVEVKAIIHESPENKNSTILKKPTNKLNSPKISRKSRKSRKSNVSVSAAETEKIELLEVEEILEKPPEQENKVPLVDEKTDAEKNQESEVTGKISNNLFKAIRTKKKIAVKCTNDEESDDSVNLESLQNSPVKEDKKELFVNEKKDVDQNPESEVVSKISNNLFKKRRAKRNIAVRCKSDEESDGSVNIESLQNSPAKNLRSATNSPLKKVVKVEDLDQIEAPDEKMDCGEEKSEEPEPPKDLSKIPKDEKLKNMLSVLQSVEDLGEDDDEVAPLIATPKNLKTPRAKRKKTSDKLPLVSRELHIEESEIQESPSVGRRSGRIARKSSVLEERKKLQEEQERQLEESDRKIELERKIRNAAVAKQRKLLAGKSRESQSEDSPGPEPESDSDCQIEEEVVATTPSRKKTDKLASIFTKSKKPDRPAEDPAVVAARKAFLMSAAPETLRTQMCRAGEEEREERGVVWPGPASLPSTTGLDTADLSQPVQLAGEWRLSADLQTSLDPSLLLRSPMLSLKTRPEERSDPTTRLVEKMSEADVLATLESRVRDNTWPDLGTFNSLVERKVRAETLEREAREGKLSESEVKAREQKRGRAKRRRSRRSVEAGRAGEGGRYEVGAGSGLVWTSKYEPRCGEQILGNSGEVARLREWLNNWTSGGGGRERTRAGSHSSNSDLTSDSEFESDQELADCPGGNTALIVGPAGCGKTATVFALAAELGFNVLEVNASSNRTGKQILSMLSEATKSQQVRQGEEKQGTLFQSLPLVKKPAAETSGKKMKTALILLEDIDVVFDDLDEGFYSAINTLSETSKRPIVMTVSQATWHLTGNGSVGEKVLKFPPQTFSFEDVGEEELARHLQTIALVEGHHISRSEVKSKVMKAVTDVRSAMLQLQFYCNSGLDLLDGPQEEEEGGGEEGAEGGVEVREWFRHLDSDTLSAGQLTPVRGIKTNLASPWSYCSKLWWDCLPGEKITPGPRQRTYPLTAISYDQFKRIDPLKNKELFDTEESEGEVEEKTEDPQPEKVVPQSLSKEERARNFRSLSALSSHLETVSQWGPERDSHGWQIVNPRPEGGQSQEFAEERDEEEERREVEAAYSQSILALSAGVVEKTLEPASYSLQLLQPDQQMERTVVTDSQLETYMSGLVDIFLVDRKGRLDLLAGLRVLARGEELRRVQCRLGRRGKTRFNHYFSQNDTFLREQTLQSLCNALLH